VVQAPFDMSSALSRAHEILRVADGSFTSAALHDGTVQYSKLATADRLLLDGIPSDVLAAVRFPMAVLPGRSVHELLRSTESLLRSFADFGGDGARCLALVILTTWFADRIPAPPTVVLVAPSPAAGAAVLLVCSRLARRSLVISAESALLTSGWASRLGATLITDASAASSRSLRWAARVNAQGFYGYAEGELRQSACPRILLATEALPLPDAIQLPILPGRVASVPGADRLEEIAREHGAGFAGYRIQHGGRFQEGSSTLMADPHGLGLLERNIASCIFDDEALKASIATLLHHQSGVRANFEAHDPLFLLTQVLISFVHDQRTTVSVEELTDRMETLTTLRGDTDSAQRISVGRMLSKLGIRRDHTNKRNVVTLDPVNKNAIHQVAWIRGVLTEGNLAGDCLFCQWLTGAEGLALANERTEGDVASEGSEDSEENEPS
jgi:hypothetical protein